MAKNYEYFYQGTNYGLDPGSDSLYVGYQSAGPVGSSTGVQTANQIKDVTNYLNQGMNVIEVGSIQPEVFDMIPKQQLKEINRLTKLTGSEVSVHAPVIEPSGFTQQGWSEQNRELAERQMTSTILRAHELNPKGEMPVTFHSSSIPGTEHIPISLIGEENLTPEEKEKYGKTGRIPITMVAVNQETGEFIPLRREKMYGPRYPEGEMHTPEQRLEMANHTYWINKITNLAFYKKEADEVLAPAYAEIAPAVLNKEEINEEKIKKLNIGIEKLERADLFLNNVETSFRTLYEEAYKYGDENVKKELRKLSEEWRERERKMKEELEKNPNQMSKMVHYVITKNNLIDDSLNRLKAISPPQLYKPVENFAIDKASETFSNTAIAAYDKFGKNAPIISIENPPYGSAISTAEDLRKLIDTTRDKFVEKAVKKGYSKSQAEQAAKQLIGATWDTSHISMIRKQGFSEDELIKEAKKIAPYVKHVHLNDNFGYTHTDLPPGMASVPFKEILKEFEKKGFKGKKIFEGGQFFQHFQTPPHAMVLEAMGSPVYSMVAQPTWTQIAGSFGDYSTGYGMMLPEQHFSMYGAGFTTLPSELGGQVSGKQSRFSGTPNA